MEEIYMTDFQGVEIPISFKAYLNKVVAKLRLPPVAYDHKLKDSEFYAIAKLILEGDTLYFRGKGTRNKDDSEEDAAKKTILYLRDVYGFHIKDCNYEDVQMLQYNNTRLTIFYEEILEENKILQEENRILRTENLRLKGELSDEESTCLGK
ncbi:hypothetical protein L1049_012146 [Liquidambar formosana]|uniref:DRBM domain-containing protein n=1 Tax=Liquidambar formosana TaxID=63359 RepID=A0AAP0RXN8_LIQFO